MNLKKILILFLILIIPFFVKAETCDNDNIIIESIESTEKSNGVTELDSANVKNNRINLNLKLLEIGDYATYKLVLTNDSMQDYNIEDSIYSSDEVISYTLQSEDNNNIIKAGETKIVYLSVRYKNKINKNDYQDGAYNNNENISFSFLRNDIISEPSSKNIENPETSSNTIYIEIIICIFSLAIIVYLLTKCKNKYIKFFIIGGLVLIPIKAFSLCYCKLNIESKITIPEYKERKTYNIIKDDVLIDDEKSENVTAESGVDFLETSSDTNGKGKYIFAPTKNDDVPIYYYRGSVDNNNIIFGNFCWKIVRTTETGGIKIIYNGVPTEGKCLSVGTDTQIASGVVYNSEFGNTKATGYSTSGGHAFKYKQNTAITNGTIFANDVSYENGQYILNDDRYSKDGNYANERDEKLATHHYTCFKNTDTGCTTVSYIYMTRSTLQFYINLTGGEKIEDVIKNDMTEQVNTNKSNVRTIIDNWYQANLLDYSEYLEDTPWCNDRSIHSLGGWDKNGSLTDKLIFNANYRITELGQPSLTCEENDKFTTSTTTGNGNLEYPIGLLTLDEAAMAGFGWNQDGTNYLSNGQVWWTMSPSLQSANYMYVGVVHIMTDNVHTGYVTGSSGGVRPAVSLNNKVIIKDGDGTKENPFTVELS